MWPWIDTQRHTLIKAVLKKLNRTSKAGLRKEKQIPRWRPKIGSSQWRQNVHAQIHFHSMASHVLIYYLNLCSAAHHTRKKIELLYVGSGFGYMNGDVERISSHAQIQNEFGAELNKSRKYNGWFHFRPLSCNPFAALLLVGVVDAIHSQPFCTSTHTLTPSVPYPSLRIFGMIDVTPFIQ